MQEVPVILYLFMNAWTDSRKRWVDLRISIFFFLIFVMEILIQKSWWRLLGILPGVCILCVSKIEKAGIGSGDGIVLAVLGVKTGFYKIMKIAFHSFWMAAVLGGIMCLIKRKRRIEIPFMPCLFLGYLWDKIG